MNPPQTAPKDRLFLAGVGLPWLVMAIWNDYQEEFVYADLETSLCEGKYDSGFFTEYAKHSEIKGWLDVPDKDMQQ